MPMFIPMIAAFVAVEIAVVAGVVIAGSMAATVLGGVVSFAVGQMMGGGQGAASSSAVTQNQAQGTLINTSSNVEPIPVVYGTRRKGGARCLAEVYAANNNGLAVLIVLGEGEIGGVSKWYLDDTEAYPNPDQRFANMQFNLHVGTDAQLADNSLVTLFPSKWTTAHTLSGVAYGVAFVTYTKDSFPFGLPVVTADVVGKLVVDPRQGSPTYIAHSDNPALCIRDYLTNSRYGRGVPESAIHDASFIVAANHCDELVTVPATGSPSFTTQKRYTCNGVLDPDAGTLPNMRSLLSSCRGSLVYSNGRYKLIIDKVDTASSFAFTEDNIIGSWQITLPGKRDKCNRVRARFFNPDRQWQPDIAVVDSPTFRAEDNGILLEREIELSFTSNIYMAQQIAQMEMKQSRIGMICQFTAMIEGMRCEVGDLVPITHTTTGWTAKLFRIIALELLSNDEAKVTAREYDAAVYDLDDLTLATAAPPTNLPDPFANLTIASLTLSSGTADLFVNGDGTVVPRIRARWPQLTNPFITHFDIQIDRTAASPTEWENCPAILGATSTEGFAHPVEDGVIYRVRVRAVTTIGNAGAWFTSEAHTVIGKTELPSDVTGASAAQQGAVVVFDCDTVLDSDLDTVEIRFAVFGNTSWADANPLTNILRGHTATSAAVPPGEWTFLFKAKDTSGNYSANASSVDLDVSASGFTSIYATAQAPTWPGTLTNMVRHWTDVLTPDSQSLASALGWEVFDQFVPNAYADCYYEAPTIDKSIDGSARVWANITSVLGPGETSGTANPKLQIDFRLDAGAFDGFESWTIGTANFRHLKARIHVPTALGKPVISGFDVHVDSTSRTETFTNQAIGSSGTVITFAEPFHSIPVIQMTPRGATALIPSAESPSTTGFTAHLYDTAGAGVAGNADIAATGA